MPDRHHVTSREVDQVRIDMTPGERGASNGGRLKRLLSSTPLDIEIIKAARQDGLMSATAHHTHYGFSGTGAIHADGAEVSNPALAMVVEITGNREQLEQFCRKHAELLQDKVLIYKHLEHWGLKAHTLLETEAAPEEYADEDEKEAAK